MAGVPWIYIFSLIITLNCSQHCTNVGQLYLLHKILLADWSIRLCTAGRVWVAIYVVCFQRSIWRNLDALEKGEPCWSLLYLLYILTEHAIIYKSTLYMLGKLHQTVGNLLIIIIILNNIWKHFFVSSWTVTFSMYKLRLFWCCITM